MNQIALVVSRSIAATALVLPILMLSGCGGGGAEVFDTVADTVEDLAHLGEKDFQPTCGVVGPALREGADREDGVFLSQVSTATPNVVSANAGDGPVVVKLLSLDFSSNPSETAVSRLAELAAGGAYLFQQPNPCSITTPDGSTATSGQLITPDGVDVAEQLVREGLSGPILGAGECGEEMLAPCYQALQAEAAE